MNKTMIIKLLELQKDKLAAQFYFSFLSVHIGLKERSMFSFWKEYRRINIDLLFIHIV